ncbi:murein biosynthesis integral membrane protein MurJ [Streptomyces sp. SCSIO ZS0520]|uniref:murein biosynthesis integral membrane protein MurJ n=1 Tax=Streptomyces sp. SCSIO ZS0520 TaxID=2892996 RepID=UPI0021D8A8B8|nr:murein biosynthesis integral membrane protein MurJ [Streptomyces sp. SCSIO ZS0520]
MNAPYDGDRGQDPRSPAHPTGPHEPGQVPPQQGADPYREDGYAPDPYGRHPYGQDGYPQEGPYAPSGGAAPSAYPQDPYGQEAYGQGHAGGQPVQQGGQPPHGQGIHPQASYGSAPQPQDAYAAQDGYGGDPYAPSPYAQGSYEGYDQVQGPYAQHGGQGQYPPAYEQTPHPGAQGIHPQQQPQYEEPYAPDPRVWAQSAAPEGQPLPYGDDGRAAQYVGVDDLVSQAGSAQQQPEHDAFAHLFRDQQHDGPVRPPAEPGVVPPSAPEPPPPPPAASTSGGGRASSILKSSALMAAGTMVSRLTGFVRTMVITAALGAAVLGDAFTVAYTLPTMIYILTVGGGLNSVFVPQLVRSMKEDEDGGEAYANRLLTLVMVILGLITVFVVLGAPLLIRLQSQSIAENGAANNVAVTFARYCLPTIFFMGVHVVMGQILNARGKFGAMMWTPVLNNIVMIFTFGLFIYVYGTAESSGVRVETIPAEGVRLLGIGTLLGLVVQALAMIPYLREAGFRFRPRFDWRGHGLGKTIKLAKWTVLFVLANQAGLLVVTQLTTAAGDNAGNQGGVGFLGYTNAQLIWAMPQAIITVSVMAAILPRISRAASDDDPGAVRDDISQGLRTSAVAIVPVSFAFIALGIPICTLLYSSSGLGAAQSMGYILMAFGIGLIPYSVQYVVLRGFYAYEDTRTPFYNTVIVAAVNAAAAVVCYLVLPARWAVVGMAASYGLAYAVGVGVAWKRLKKLLGGDLDGPQVLRTYARLSLASVPAALVSGFLGYFVMETVGKGVLGAIAALLVGGVALLAVFYLAARKMRIQEMNAMVAMVRGRLGR